MIRVIVLLVAGAAAACSDFASGGDESARMLRMDPHPTFVLGVEAGDDSEMFHQIIGVALVSDSVLAVVDGGYREVRLYDMKGRFLRRLAGAGEGPGELQSASVAWKRSDGAVEVIDVYSHRALVATADGDVSTTPLPTESSGRFLMVQFMGRIGEEWLVETSEPVPFPGAGEVLRFIVGFHAWDGESIDVERGIDVPSLWWYTTRAGRPVRLPLWMAPNARASASGDIGAVLDPANFLVHLYDGAGSGWRTVDLPHACGAVPPGALEAGVADSVELRAGVPLQEFRGLIPDCLPAYDRISTTSDGRVWVRESQKDDGDGSVDRWWVFQVGSDERRWVDLPRGFTPLDIAEDHLFGRYTDALGVQFVHGYRVEP